LHPIIAPQIASKLKAFVRHSKIAPKLLHHPNASKLESFCLPLKSLHPIAPKNASKDQRFSLPLKSLHPICTTKCFKAESSCLAHKKLAPNSNTKKCFKAQSFCFSTQKTYTQLHNKMLQNSKLLFGTQKLTPNCTTKCSKTQNFCLALKSLHPIIGNASKLQIQASNFFKMRQDPEPKKIRKKTPSKHHHQNTKHSPYHHEEELKEEVEK
jgi:hypothetical protein